MKNKYLVVGLTSLSALLGILSLSFLKRGEPTHTNSPLMGRQFDLDAGQLSLQLPQSELTFRTPLGPPPSPEDGITSLYDGAVYCSPYHLPLQDVHVSFLPLENSSQDSTTGFTAITNENGAFSLPLQQITYSVILKPPLPYAVETGFIDAEPHMKFFVEPAITLEGIVQCVHGNPVVNASVFPLDPITGKKILGNYQDPPAITDSNGLYIIQGVNKHGSTSFSDFPNAREKVTIDLFARHESLFQIYSQWITLEPKKLETDHFVVDPILMTDKLSTIALQFDGFCDSDNITASLQSHLYSPQSPAYLNRILSLNGSLIIFDDVPPSTYNLLVTGEHCASWSTSFRANKDLTLRVPLIQGYSLSGSISFSDTTPMPKMPVTLFPISLPPKFPTTKIEARTDSDGVYCFEHLPPGSYTLDVRYGNIKYEKQIFLQNDTLVDSILF